MLVRLHERLRAWRAQNDEGATLVVVIIVMMILMTGAIVVAGLVTATAGAVVSSRSTAESRAAADAGLAAAISQAKRTGEFCDKTFTSSTPDYDVNVTCDYAAATFTAEGRGAHAGLTKTRAVYSYVPNDLSGALVSATVTGGELSASALQVSGGNVIVDDGGFNCNRAMTLHGDVIVRDGYVRLSNGCTVDGNVYADGDVELANEAAVTGDVVALGSFVTSNVVHVDGNVFARGTVTLQNGARVGGSVVSASSGLSLLAGVGTLQSVRTAGPITLTMDVTGDVESTAPGAVSTIGAVTVGGTVRIAGSLTEESGPTDKSRTVTGATGLVPPVVRVPTVLLGDAFAWTDYTFDADQWSAEGYDVRTWSTCDAFADATLVAQLNALTAPTVIDARGCAKLSLNSVELKAKTDITFVAKDVTAEGVKITSGDGAPHSVNIIIPDTVADNRPTCSPSSAQLWLVGAKMSAPITGVAYSPCQLSLDSTSSSTWNGQVYAGNVFVYGDLHDAVGMKLHYEGVSVPGLTGDAGAVGETGLPGTDHLTDIIARRDIK